MTPTEHDAVRDLRRTAEQLRGEAMKAKQHKTPGEFRNLPLRLSVGARQLEETALFIERRAQAREQAESPCPR